MITKTDILRPYTADHCERMAAFMDAQVALLESAGHEREADDCRQWAARWRRSAHVAREREGMLW